MQSVRQLSYTCIARVWDSGDMTTCGSSPTLGQSELCESCWLARVKKLSTEVEELSQKLGDKADELQRLRELGWAEP